MLMIYCSLVQSAAWEPEIELQPEAAAPKPKPPQADPANALPVGVTSHGRAARATWAMSRPPGTPRGPRRRVRVTVPGSSRQPALPCASLALTSADL